MSAAELSQTITLIAFWTCIIVVFIFIVMYLTLAKWEEHVMGRHILAFSVSTLAVLLQGMIGFLSPGYPGQLIIRPLLYTTFAAVWVWRIILFLKDQRIAREHLEDERNNAYVEQEERGC